jgi:hypothetical protein
MRIVSRRKRIACYVAGSLLVLLCLLGAARFTTVLPPSYAQTGVPDFLGTCRAHDTDTPDRKATDGLASSLSRTMTTPGVTTAKGLGDGQFHLGNRITDTGNIDSTGTGGASGVTSIDTPASFPTLNENEAVDLLKQRKLYGSLREAMQSALYKIGPEGFAASGGARSTYHASNRANKLDEYITPSATQII